MKYKQTFTIDRKFWLRGVRDSVLRQSRTKKMCCLGQVSKQCGVSERRMIEIYTPKGLFIWAKNVPSSMSFLISKSRLYKGIATNSKFSKKAMSINDNLKTTDAQKEKALKELFKAEGYGLKFIN